MTQRIDLRLEITELRKTLYVVHSDGTADVLASTTLAATRNGAEQCWRELCGDAIDALCVESYGGSA